MNGILRLLCVAFLAWALSSCATPYQQSGITGGYSEKKISDSAYTVSFSGNGFASKDRVYFFWIYRCAELTLQRGYSLYVIRPNKPQVQNALPDAALQPALYTNDNGGELVKTHGGGGGAVIIVPGGGSGANKWTYSATVLMYNKPLPQEVLWGVDAEQITTLLKPYVTSNGNIPPPDRNEVFRKAFLAHSRISIGEDATVALDDVAPANADGSPRPDLRIRTSDSIADTVSNTRLIALHAMFRAYVAQQKALDPSGEIVLQFSVSPNGQTRGCRATSSSINDRAFIDAVVALIGQTEFSPLDVGMTRVKNFRISFAELPEGVT